MADDEVNRESPVDTLPLIGESAVVEKLAVQTGKVSVHTITDHIEETVRAALQSESYEVTRVSVDRQIDTAPQIRTEGDLTIIPVLEEVLFVEKRLVLKEEIHLRRHAATDMTETPVTLRRQRAVVDYEETPVEGAAPPSIPSLKG